MELPALSEPYDKFLTTLPEGPHRLTAHAVIVMFDALPDAHHKALREASGAEVQGDQEKFERLLGTTYDNIEQLFDNVLSRNHVTPIDDERWRIPALLAMGAWMMMSDYLGD